MKLELRFLNDFFGQWMATATVSTTIQFAIDLVDTEPGFLAGPLQAADRVLNVVRRDLVTVADDHGNRVLIGVGTAEAAWIVSESKA